jgi:long-chain acyl-CoA synthetase
MLTHGNLESNVQGSIEHAGISYVDTFLGVLPQFHSFGLTGLTLLPLTVGATVVYSARFVPRQIIKLIRKHRPVIMMAVPSMYGALLLVKDATVEDFSCVRIPISGGEPLPDATYEAFKQKFAIRLLEGYGLTETSPIACWCTPEMRKRHSVGTPLPDVSFMIVDEHDNPLPTNTEGEIFIAGPNIMEGYYHLPKQTDQVICHLLDPATGREKRFFRSGDIGKLDDDGFLYITGRKKEMLIIAGENVFPREIEEVLNRHESVSASAVIGKNDGMRGEVPVAFVELNEDAQFDDKALRSWCRDNLAPFKAPREIRQIDQLPRNPTGKIMRRHLKL